MLKIEQEESKLLPKEDSNLENKRFAEEEISSSSKK
jgi:hypothetical protein